MLSKLDAVWVGYCLQCGPLSPVPMNHALATEVSEGHGLLHKVVGVRPFDMVQNVPREPDMADRRAMVLKIVSERERQDKLKAEGRFAYTCADTEADHGMCLAILLEEIGEIGQALALRLSDPSWASLAWGAANLGETARSLLNQKLLSNDPPHHRPDRDPKKELIQSAAVILAWLEGFDEKAS